MLRDHIIYWNVLYIQLDLFIYIFDFMQCQRLYGYFKAITKIYQLK